VLIKRDQEIFRYESDLDVKSNKVILYRLPGKSHQNIYNPSMIKTESLNCLQETPIPNRA
jgi:hypothetical protein